jgi:hypothetical protein
LDRGALVEHVDAGDDRELVLAVAGSLDEFGFPGHLCPAHFPPADRLPHRAQ